MFHFGKTPEGELDIRVDGKEVGVLYRAIATANLPERGTLHNLKTYLEENFKDEIKTRPVIESINQ
jgi:hypothetical protein